MTIILYANLYKQSVDSIKSFLFSTRCIIANYRHVSWAYERNVFLRYTMQRLKNKTACILRKN